MSYQCTCCRPSATCALIEIRELRTPEGRAAAMERYHQELRERAAERDSAPTERETASRLVKLGAPGDAIAVVSKPDDGPAIEGARRFIRAPYNVITFFMLLGSTGVGKTVAATFVLADFARKYRWNEQPTGSNENPALFVKAARLTSLTDWNADHARWLDQLIGARLLVLDDLGDEGTPSAIQRVTDLLLARADKRRRTVLTSNLDAKSFERRYGAALFDRLRTMSITPSLAGLKSHRKRSAA